MSKESQNILSVLRTALKIESDGANFYSMAAETSQNSKAKDVFNFLVAEEKKHYQFFLDQFKAVESGSGSSFSQIVKQMEDAPTSKEIFDEEYFKRIKGGNYSLSAVSIGIQLEMKSIEFYKGQRAHAKDESAKRFYDFLIKTELSHHDILTKMEKEMLEESWSENRFSPF